jgi:hypothetical protein
MPYTVGYLAQEDAVPVAAPVQKKSPIYFVMTAVGLGTAFSRTLPLLVGERGGKKDAALIIVGGILGLIGLAKLSE